MEIIAKSKYVRQSPRKLRLVAKMVRGMMVDEAEVLLSHMNKKAARLILLTLKQGIGNAVNNFQLEKMSLKIKALEVNEGPGFKRMDKSHRAFRWGNIKKRTAHISMVIEGKEKKSEKPVKAVTASDAKAKGKKLFGKKAKLKTKKLSVGNILKGKKSEVTRSRPSRNEVGKK
ncbi:50S ribosomal protein L22 [Patescibacteria group bacterium]